MQAIVMTMMIMTNMTMIIMTMMMMIIMMMIIMMMTKTTEVIKLLIDNFDYLLKLLTSSLN